VPAVLNYPGVYVEEIPSGVRTIVGVPTSIAAFIGCAQKGPVNQATVINSYADYERIFGGLWLDSTMSFAVRDFFLNGGGQAVIVRLFHTPAPPPAVPPGGPPAAPHPADFYKIAIGDWKFIAASQGKWAGNLRVRIATPDANSAKVVAPRMGLAPEDLYNVTVRDTAPGGLTEQFMNVSVKPGPRRIDNVLLHESQLLRWDGNMSEPPPKSPIDTGGPPVVPPVGGPPVVPPAGGPPVVPPAGGPPVVPPAGGPPVVPPAGGPPVVPPAGGPPVVPPAGGPPVVPPAGAPPAAPPPQTWVTDHVWTLETALGDAIKAQGANSQQAKDAASKLADEVKKVMDALTDGDALTKADFTPDHAEADKHGLYALEQLFATAGLFNLLCLPPPTASGDIEAALIDEAAAYCEKRRAMLLVDAPTSWKTPQTAHDNFANQVDFTTTSRNAAVFFPRLKQPNPLRDNQVESFASCGTVAGIFARTDTQRGVWKAPAGLDAGLVAVPELTVPLTDDENGMLNPLGINCVRSFPVYGRVVWGARTLRGADQLADEYKYIPVRRTALYIEESLYRGLKWVVFEPNDEPLWAQIRLNVGAFMHNLFRQGAFQGQSPRQAYFVRCDGTTTIQNDINLGIVNILVGFAPLKPAEFVVIKLQQIAGQIEV
jgi:phage tail sheath protein FI